MKSFVLSSLVLALASSASADVVHADIWVTASGGSLVTAGASAPDDLVRSVVARLDPVEGVEPVFVTDEDEYFPPPRELRELVPALDAVVGLLFGADPEAARRLGGPFAADREVDASAALAGLTDLDA